MTANPIAGTLVFLLGGIAAATYLLPFRGVRGWAYETGWLVSVLAGWLVFPLVFDAFVVPDFWGVMGTAPLSALLRSFGIGALWGVASAGINFGLQGAPELESAALAADTAKCV
jgi:L-rhamnose-H+ transport protein